jgi:hypothetical protein
MGSYAAAAMRAGKSAANLEATPYYDRTSYEKLADLI